MKLISVNAVTPKGLQKVYINTDRILAIQAPDNDHQTYYTGVGVTISKEINTLIFTESLVSPPILVEGKVDSILKKLRSE